MTFVKQLVAKTAIFSLLVGAQFLIPAHIENAEAADDPIRVFMDHARILKFDENVSSVIVGNAEIADITVSDPTTVVLTAKSYGSTNLVILDGKGEPVLDKRIVVTVDEANSVRVFRQAERTVLSCSPNCENTATE